MESSKDPGHIRRLKKVSYLTNVPEEIIEEALSLCSEYIKNKISQVDTDSIRDKELLTEDEFNKLFPIIKFPSIGYLKPNYRKYKIIEKNKRAKIEKNGKKH